MDSPIYRAATAEIERLKREIQASPAGPLFQEYLKAQDVLLMYGPPIASNRADAPPKSATAHKEGTEAARVVAAAKDYLEERGTRVASGEIARALESRGVKIGGTNKGSRVSAYLSAADKIFDNIRGQGYGLVSSANGQAH
jgi:hypothetical protein